MKLLSRRDVLSASITGLTTGVIAWRLLVFLRISLPAHIAPASLVIFVPFLWLAGVQFGYLLMIFFRPMGQFGKFAAIGFANAAIDFGALYLLIAFTGRNDGLDYAFFKTASFSLATIHSYLWNKYWAFDAGRQTVTRSEITSFGAVSLASLMINVVVASVVVLAGPLGGLSPNAWAGIGALAGSAVALISNFIGLRVFVFKSK